MMLSHLFYRLQQELVILSFPLKTDQHFSHEENRPRKIENRFGDGQDSLSHRTRTSRKSNVVDANGILFPSIVL